MRYKTLALLNLERQIETSLTANIRFITANIRSCQFYRRESLSRVYKAQRTIPALRFSLSNSVEDITHLK